MTAGTTNHTTWDALKSLPGLYHRQHPKGERTANAQPLLLLHGVLSSHRAWDQLAYLLGVGGVPDIYALDIPEMRAPQHLPEALPRLHDAILTILARHPEAQQLVLIGHGAGGLLGYRYCQHWPDNRLSFLIMLGTPHKHTAFRRLAENPIRAIRVEDESEANLASRTNPVDFNRISALQERSATVTINILGQAGGPDFDGVVRGLRLPEAINHSLPLRHYEMNKDLRVVDFILECLHGGRYQVKLKLVGMQMRRADKDNLAGPVAFEVNGLQYPADTVFQPIADRMYLFEEAVPPLCTLSVAAQQVTTMLALHLRDLSNTSGRRRRMYTRLFIPLRDDDSTAHTMQDSEGSDFLWRVVVERLPAVVGSPWYDEYAETVSRGI